MIEEIDMFNGTLKEALTKKEIELLKKVSNKITKDSKICDVLMDFEYNKKENSDEILKIYNKLSQYYPIYP